MNKKLLAVAVAAALAPAFASAQTNVTMFGVIDTGLTWAKAGNQKVSGMDQNALASNRFGVRGSEDLGGGLRANFHLESGMSANGAASGAQNAATGTAIDFSTRLAYLGLAGGFGEVRMGRQYTSAFVIQTGYDLFGTNGVASALNIMSAVRTSAGGAAVPAGNAATAGLGATSQVRTANAIQWLSPNWSGFTATAMMNFGERQNATGAERQMGGSLKYAAKVWSIALGYNNQKDNGVAAGVGGPGSTERIRQWILAGDVNFGAFKVLLGHQNLRNSGNTLNVAGAPSMRAKDWWIGGQYSAGAHTVKLQYNRRNATSTLLAGSAGDASQWGIGYIYALSKRTEAYAHYARIGNKGGAGGSAYQVATTNLTLGYGGTGGQNSSGFQFGVAHKF